MINEKKMKTDFCCICGEKLDKTRAGSIAPGEIKGTWECIGCANKKERNEFLLNKRPAYIPFEYKWLKPRKDGRIFIEVPDKQKHYITQDGRSYHVIIWEDE